MNLFNRALVALMGFKLMLGGLFVLAIDFNILRPENMPLGEWSRVLEPLGNLGRTASLQLAAVGILGILIGLLLLRLELRLPGRGDRIFTVTRSPLGHVTIPRKSVQQLADRAAAMLPGVMEVESRVREGRQGLHISSRVSVSPDESLPEVAAALQRQIKAGVEHHLGRLVTEVTVQAQLEPMRGSPTAGRRVS